MGVNPNTKIANRVTDLKGKGMNEPSGGSKRLSHPGRLGWAGRALPGRRPDLVLCRDRLRTHQVGLLGGVWGSDERRRALVNHL
jgi:hypothetical protein